jgi:ligand-binding SRPBCC domain-containing protein
MPRIELRTFIDAPIDRCFDLSRSIDLHKISTQHTGEEAVEGVTSGLIGLGQSVTWRAKHFGIWQQLTTTITDYNRPSFFADEMVKGAFKSFRHEHHFREISKDQTEMVDYFDYRSPLGMLGKLADKLFLDAYMRKLLMKRNTVIKEIAESDQWVKLLNDQP